jgi:NAD(P)-dependent dehydrogenase (short-subunit alcohol dehydrogenase family)
MRHAAALIAKSEPVDDGERGVIVNTASIAAFEGQVSQIAYAASKGGVVAMTLPAARDLAAYGIRVCTIAPGIFATPLVAAMPEEHRTALTQGVVFPNRPGKPSEFGQLVRCIAENAYLNGEVIRLDGALRLSRK